MSKHREARKLGLPKKKRQGFFVIGLLCHEEFFKLGLAPGKAEQPLQGMELKKKHKQINAYRESF